MVFSEVAHRVPGLRADTGSRYVGVFSPLESPRIVVAKRVSSLEQDMRVARDGRLVFCRRLILERGMSIIISITAHITTMHVCNTVCMPAGCQPNEPNPTIHPGQAGLPPAPLGSALFIKWVSQDSQLGGLSGQMGLPHPPERRLRYEYVVLDMALVIPRYLMCSSGDKYPCIALDPCLHPGLVWLPGTQSTSTAGSRMSHACVCGS